MTEDYRQYLDPRVLSRIAQFELKARLIVEGFLQGLHRSPFHGFSVEFAEHRDYVAGDDVRHVDWKAYAKTNRLYIKQYEEETNLRCTIALDTSRSMAYASNGITKLQYGAFVAGSMAFLAHRQRDAVGLALLDASNGGLLRGSLLRHSAHPAHLKMIFRSLQNATPEGRSRLGAALHELAGRIPERGLVAIISDFFAPLNDTLAALRHLRHRRHDIIAFHILDPDEISFPFEHPMLFRDLEGEGELVADARALRDGYLHELRSFVEHLRRGCQQNEVDYSLLETSQPLDVALSKYLAARLARR